jgi:hypothetical protein
MLRCTIEILPGGDESKKRTIGCVEIANVGGTMEIGDYAVVLKKTPPFRGALKAAWRKGHLQPGRDDEEIMTGAVIGHHRQKRGSYDLLYRALRVCGLEMRNP